MNQSLDKSKWVCTDPDMEEEFGMTCIVISGEINPDWNGDNDIKIQYENGSIDYMKLRRFLCRFKQITTPLTIKERRSMLTGKLQKAKQIAIELELEINSLQDECNHPNIRENKGSGSCPDCGWRGVDELP
ncbi:hypothetical protein [Shouchella clausii]|uniref:Uncharacterized protein n=1 Tax=Shouchella clausii TaxID=79880 RepID=A0A268NWQ5_SHOCL|nr:hypothetical protein [Shouchella clausii]PAE87831.1 hypothetical protein CHH72_16500 [Shouchella clausii]